jgi:N,N'-diacetyllegionaminate synthase
MLVVAEIGSVHDGSLGNACKLIEVAKECGADAVKFQTHMANAETLKNAPAPSYFKGEPRYEYFQRTAFTKTQWKELACFCKEVDIEFLSSPFSNEAVDLLEDIGVRRYKVGSGEVTNLPMLERIAKTMKPVLLSSGMSSWEELDAAVETLRAYHEEIIVMQCTSEYPCSYENVGLNLLDEMQKRYNLPVGLSDHSMTNYASFAAVTIGAVVVEKHLTFSRKMYGSDARHSLEPAEFKDLCDGIKAIDIFNRTPINKDRKAEDLQEMKDIFQKSVVAGIEIKEGEVITEDVLAFKKPGTGFPASKYKELIGKKAKQTLSTDKFIYPDMLSEG